MLRKINDKCFTALCGNVNFILKKGEIGVCSAGTCWRLMMQSQGIETVISCFVTIDDGHDCRKKYSCDGRLWTENEIVTAANQMINDIIK